MSYVKPSVLVYQELANAGGVANVTPDLEVCIIGPAYNVLQYVVGSSASQIQTACTSVNSTTGVISSGSTLLTVGSTAGLSVGDTLLVAGADSSGGTLQSNILSISGNVVTLDTAAGTTVATAGAVLKAGILANNSVTNTFNLPGQIPGQVVDPASVNVWTSNSKVQALLEATKGASGYTTLTVANGLSVTGTTTVSGTTVTITAGSALAYVAGDTITIPGAGAAGATLTATVVSVNSSSSITITPAATLAVTSAVITKVLQGNVNTTTNTLRAAVGDSIVLTYVNTSAATTSFSSTIKTVSTTNGLNGNVTSFTISDLLPADASVSTTTTGTNALAATAITVVSSTGINVYDHVTIAGGGLNGADLIAKVTAATGTSITIDTVGGLQTALAAGAVVLRHNYFSTSVQKAYSDIKILSGSINTSNASSLGQVTVNIQPQTSYGTLVSGNIYSEYRALRTDLAGQILSINNATDLEQQLGTLTDANPLGLACEMALANTVTRVRAIAVQSNDLIGYSAALTTAQGERVYALVPLTQDPAICQAVVAHAQQMSTPENALWRIALVNTAIPTQLYIGPYNPNSVNTGAVISKVNGKTVITASNATFIADGVVPTDVVVVTAPVGAAGSYVVQDVLGTQLILSGVSAGLALPATGISYYVVRTLGRTASANQVEGQSTVYKTNRAWYIQPDSVGISIGGVVKYLPGYYLCAAHGGMVAGFPVQQGFTNIGVAGISDLQHSNFFFAKADLNAMAAAGVCLYVQDTQGGTPYCRHAITTDPSVLQYREQMAVKVWDYLSYYFYDVLKSFIGVWNITPDSIVTLRQVITAGGELIKGKKLPKLGAPLTDMTIKTLQQDPYNQDHVQAVLNIKIPYSMNYIDLHLVV